MIDYSAVGQEATKIIVEHLKVLLPPIGAVTAFTQGFKITLRGEGVKTHWCIWVVTPFLLSSIWVLWTAFPPIKPEPIFRAFAMSVFLGGANIAVYFVPPVRKFLNTVEAGYIAYRFKMKSKKKKEDKKP